MESASAFLKVAINPYREKNKNNDSNFSKMRENTLLKVALICSLVGLTALIFISQSIEVPDYKPPESNKNIGDDVKLTGVITKIQQNNGFVFIEIVQENKVSAVMFSNDNISLSKNNNVEIFGKVQEYNGKPEIIAQKIRVIK